MPGSPREARAEIPLGRVKAFYFASFCQTATWFRYLTLFLADRGLTAAEIGTLWSVYRFTGMASTPLWAALADRSKRARTIHQASLLLSIPPFIALALPVAPGYRFEQSAAIVWLYGIAIGPSMCLRDALARAACEQDTERWGKSRVYGAVGWGLAHLILGPLVDRLGFGVLFVSNVMCTLVLFFVSRSSVPMACGQVRTEVSFSAISGILLKNKLFFINICAIGAGFSMVEGMLFLLLEQMHASTVLCGLSVLVTVVFELPIFYYAGAIVKKLGTRKMILLGQAAWVVRAFFYASMSVAWTVLLIEPLHGVTFSLVWSGAQEHISDPAVSGEGLEASSMALLGVCFTGIGAGVGLIVGGMLFDHLGSHAVYALFGLCILAFGTVYAVCGSSEATSFGNGGRGVPLPSTLGKGEIFGDDEPIVDGRIDAVASDSAAEMSLSTIYGGSKAKHVSDEKILT